MDQSKATKPEERQEEEGEIAVPMATDDGDSKAAAAGGVAAGTEKKSADAKPATMTEATPASATTDGDTNTNATAKAAETATAKETATEPTKTIVKEETKTVAEASATVSGDTSAAAPTTTTATATTPPVALADATSVKDQPSDSNNVAEKATPTATDSRSSATAKDAPKPMEVDDNAKPTTNTDTNAPASTTATAPVIKTEPVATTATKAETTTSTSGGANPTPPSNTDETQSASTEPPAKSPVKAEATPTPTDAAQDKTSNADSAEATKAADATDKPSAQPKEEPKDDAKAPADKPAAATPEAKATNTPESEAKEEKGDEAPQVPAPPTTAAESTTDTTITTTTKSKAETLDSKMTVPAASDKKNDTSTATTSASQDGTAKTKVKDESKDEATGKVAEKVNGEMKDQEMKESEEAPKKTTAEESAVKDDTDDAMQVDKPPADTKLESTEATKTQSVKTPHNGPKKDSSGGDAADKPATGSSEATTTAAAKEKKAESPAEAKATPERNPPTGGPKIKLEAKADKATSNKPTTKMEESASKQKKKKPEPKNQDTASSKAKSEPTEAARSKTGSPSAPSPKTSKEAGKGGEATAMDTDEVVDSTPPASAAGAGAVTTAGADSNEDPKSETASGKSELAYSTRGRTTTTSSATSSVAGAEGTKASTNNHANEKGDRRGGGRDTHTDDAARSAEPTPAPMGAFLDSLNEEERRTRTRFLPDVDGMRALRKSEVKDDLALARVLMGSDGQRRPKLKKMKPTEIPDGMQVEGEESPPTSEAESDVVRPDTSTVNLGIRELLVPSKAFVPPPALIQGDSVDIMEGTVDEISGADVIPPSIVESITAFNPPRPPESVGTKKKHRMLRWERRPQDVELDLRNYRKTVQRTRHEFGKATIQKQRLETLNAHLRRHFLSHLNYLNEEYHLLNSEYGSVQEECVKLMKEMNAASAQADKIGSDSRSIMADTMIALKNQGDQMSKQKATDLQAKKAAKSIKSQVHPNKAGLGGLTHGAFRDWSRNSKFANAALSNGWVLPGDRVQTPFGDGKVIRIDFPKLADGENNGHTNGNDMPQGRNGWDAASETWDVTPPRIAVALNHGTGYFPSKSITLKDHPMSLSDPLLVKRWDLLVEMAQTMGPSLDIEGIQTAVKGLKSSLGPSDSKAAMPKVDAKAPAAAAASVASDGGDASPSAAAKITETNESSITDGAVGPHSDAKTAAVTATTATTTTTTTAAIKMETDDVKGQPTKDVVAGADADADAINGEEDKSEGPFRHSKNIYLPYGAGLLPTRAGRGVHLDKIKMEEVEKAVQDALFDGEGVLGTKSNMGVTAEIRELEDRSQEYATLMAEVSQQRNALFRQRRIRTLNERTHAATTERAARIEGLVEEMRSDLNSLKRRLDDELTELGISQGSVNAILTKHYETKHPDIFKALGTAAAVVQQGDSKRQKVSDAPNKEEESGGGGAAKAASETTDMAVDADSNTNKSKSEAGTPAATEATAKAVQSAA